MKKLIFFCFCILKTYNFYSQLQWQKGGNNIAPPPFPPTIGSNATWNSQIKFITAGIDRAMFNPNVTNVINGQPAIPRNGFLGVGNPLFFMPPSFSGTGPFSVLHLNGDNSPINGPQQAGYRNWMHYGIVSTHNRDLMFMGQRSNGAYDVTDAVFAWADNNVQDNMVFTFLTEGGPGPGDLTGSGPNGREIVRYTSGGNIGVGPRFNGAFAPQSTLHMHRENSANNFLQITNQASPIAGNPLTNAPGPTAVGGLDGLRLGIDAPNNGYLVNTENRPIIFGTNNAERMRVMNITNLTFPFPLNPGGLAGDLTRVSISHNPAAPLTRPLAALHIGYNTGSILGPATTDGWRNWMDCGMLVTRETDNVYLGLKPEPGGFFGQNRQDAVLAWGDDLSNVPGNVGPDRFRIIFTTFTTATSPTVMTSQNGLEFARFTPGLLNNNTVAHPKIGIGDFQSMGNLDPNNTVEINTPLGAAPLSLGAGVNAPFIPGSWPGSTGASGLRFRDLTSLSVVVPTVSYAQATINPTKVLSVDGNGDVVLINPAATVLTNNGISTTSTGIVQLGINCPETNTAIVSQFQLINNRQVPMNNNNFVFTNTNGLFAGQNNVGVGTGCVPGNRLEVDRNTGLAFTSGLRLSQFAVGAPTVAAFQNRILSVDASGDVILSTVPTPTGGGTSIGNYCNLPQNPLVGSDYEIPTGGFNYRFTGQSIIAPGAPQQDMVSIGYPCAVPLPVSKFSVLEQQTVAVVPFENYAGHFKNSNIPDASSANFITGGVFGQARGNVSGFIAFPPPVNSGGVFQASGALGNIGVFGRISGTTTPQLFANNGPYAIGGCFISDSNMVVGGGIFTTMNYGVYSYADNSSASSNFGVFTESPIGLNNSALFVSGDAFITGSDNFASDQILKQNITPLSNALTTINQLQPKSFNYNNSLYPQMNLASGLQFGLIAQQVQTVLPNIVNSTTYPPKSLNGQNYPAQQYLTLEYTQLIPILIKAVQELSAQNQSQDSLIQVLTQNINACCENQQAKQTGVNGNNQQAQEQILNQLNVDLSDKDVIVLNQNIPNPYAEHTIITYNVPAQYGFAQIIFKTIDGKIIKAVDIEKKGRGQLNVFAADLTNGLYMYTLIVDGKEIDTKKMVKQQ
ncbi:MAG: tail fiber domain-containing protein [Sphingobacteriaceae bacterium]|nr:tail fiber domain-containing protein [Sphingobacteriaceae bacterium]